MPAAKQGADRTKVLSVRLTTEEFEARSARATEVGVGPSTLARTLVRQGLTAAQTPLTPLTPLTPPAHATSPTPASTPASTPAPSAPSSALEARLVADLTARVEALEQWTAEH